MNRNTTATKVLAALAILLVLATGDAAKAPIKAAGRKARVEMVA